MKVPADFYEPSQCQYDVRVPEADCPSERTIRMVRQNGSMKWKGKMIFVSESLVGEALGLKEVDDDLWDIYLCN